MTQQEAALNRCADFLAKMIEKYKADVMKELSKKDMQESRHK